MSYSLMAKIEFSVDSILPPSGVHINLLLHQLHPHTVPCHSRQEAILEPRVFFEHVRNIRCRSAIKGMFGVSTASNCVHTTAHKRPLRS